MQHLSASFRSQLPEVLGYRSRLLCRWADDGDRPMAGAVLVARPGANLTIDAAFCLRSQRAAKPPLGWPSVDIFFHSMAPLGPGAVAIVLSGMMHDGASGMRAVRRAGGATIAQQPESAAHPEMPRAAADLARADMRLCPEAIAGALRLLPRS